MDVELARARSELTLVPVRRPVDKQHLGARGDRDVAHIYRASCRASQILDGLVRRANSSTDNRMWLGSLSRLSLWDGNSVSSSTAHQQPGGGVVPPVTMVNTKPTIHSSETSEPDLSSSRSGHPKARDVVVQSALWRS